MPRTAPARGTAFLALASAFALERVLISHSDWVGWLLGAPLTPDAFAAATGALRYAACAAALLAVAHCLATHRDPLQAVQRAVERGQGDLRRQLARLEARLEAAVAASASAAEAASAAAAATGGAAAGWQNRGSSATISAATAAATAAAAAAAAASALSGSRRQRALPALEYGTGSGGGSAAGCEVYNSSNGAWGTGLSCD